MCYFLLFPGTCNLRSDVISALLRIFPIWSRYCVRVGFGKHITLSNFYDVRSKSWIPNSDLDTADVLLCCTLHHVIIVTEAWIISVRCIHLTQQRTKLRRRNKWSLRIPTISHVVSLTNMTIRSASF